MSENKKLLLKNCSILKGDGTHIKNGFLGICGDTIDYIGTDKPDSYEDEKDMKGAMLIPGFINCHGHAAMVLLRGIGSGLPLNKWLEDAMWPIEDRMTKEDMAAGNALAQLEMIRTGTTCYADMYMFEETAAELCESSGMKVNLSRPVLCFDENESVKDNYRAMESIELFNNWNGAFHGRVAVDFCLHAEYTNKPKLIEEYAALCFEKGARMHIHLSETKAEHEECKKRYGKTPTRLFYDLGLFKSPVMAAHCVYVEDEDMAVMRESGASAVLNPSSNMKLGSGFAPVKKLLQNGVNVALGTDGAASNNNLNMLEELHLLSVIYNGFNQNPEEVLPGEALKIAFSNGAKALGRSDIGGLEVGKKADIVAISMDEPHLYPSFDAVSTLLYSAQGSDVSLTMADGKILYEDGEFLTLDKEKVVFEAEKAIKRLYNA